MILHIIGLILKIIGIILLVILGILLLVIGVLLFVPLRYELRAEFPGKLEDAEGNLKISWLLHLIAGRVEYRNGDVKWQGRIAWKKLGDVLEAEDKPVRKKEKKPDGGKKAGAENASERTAERNDAADVKKPQTLSEKRAESGTYAKPEHTDVKDEKSKTETQGNPFQKKKKRMLHRKRKVNPEKKRMFMTREDPERLTKLHESGRNQSKHLEN